MEKLRIHIERLRSSGLRPTKQRLALCKILFDRKGTFHLTIEQLKKRAGFNEGGMPTQRKGNLDYRSSTVTNRVDNRKNK